MQASQQAASAAIRVPRKFTKSLLTKRRLSSQAPRKLSAIMPRTAAPTEIASHCGGSNPPRRQTELTIPAATTPASGPDQAYRAIGSRRDGTPGRDQAGLLAEGLAHFAGNRVGGSFRERRCHGQQKNCPVMAEDG